jgi:hypothetical protein
MTSVLNSTSSTDSDNRPFGIEEEVLHFVKSSYKCGLSSTIEEIQERLSAGNRELATECIAAITSLQKSGSILVKGGEISLFGERTAGDAHERRKRGNDYMSFGVSFLEKVLPSVPEVIMAGVCGSVSYGSAAEGDDVDIILICRSGSLWGVLKKVLLAARAVRKKESWRPVICLSYCAEDRVFRDEVANHRTRLFTSDCLNIRVVKGENYYRSVLAGNGWMRSFFPAAYAARLRDGVRSETQDENWNIAGNVLDYMLIGNYLKVMARMRNLVFHLKGRDSAFFTARIERDRCIYASDRWRKLEES